MLYTLADVVTGLTTPITWTDRHFINPTATSFRVDPTSESTEVLVDLAAAVDAVNRRSSAVVSPLNCYSSKPVASRQNRSIATFFINISEGTIKLQDIFG